ncbi:hypothetical protein BGP77_00765 [Saccharospirillum sp. MSK14-1]|nr:hypothetical protein BGP77_00765 [Saccharospirillum sp. MSK14-1]
MNQLERQRLPDGQTVLVKRNAAAPDDFYAAEAAGLQALADTGWRVPKVVSVARHRLVIEAIELGRPQSDSWQQAGRQLAQQHRCVAERFGFSLDTFCGDSRQANDWCDDGGVFYQQQRYKPQVQRARDAGLLSTREVQSIERLVDRLPSWLPPQSPALLHGDLWSGNLLFDRSGEPVMIDPACYYGWPEADLAMTHAFGGFAPEFYRAYQAESPLLSGF